MSRITSPSRSSDRSRTTDDEAYHIVTIEQLASSVACKLDVKRVDANRSGG
jgi:hypothetical protein